MLNQNKIGASKKQVILSASVVMTMKKMIMNCFHGIVKLLIYIFLIAHDHAENLTMKKLVEGVLDFDSVGLVLNVLIFLGEKMKQFFYRSKLLPFTFKL